jgi:hypothetical protein
MFSDPSHVNRIGAEAYTRMLWDVVGPELQNHKRPAGS